MNDHVADETLKKVYGYEYPGKFCSNGSVPGLLIASGVCIVLTIVLSVIAVCSTNMAAFWAIVVIGLVVDVSLVMFPLKVRKDLKRRSSFDKGEQMTFRGTVRAYPANPYGCQGKYVVVRPAVDNGEIYYIRLSSDTRSVSNKEFCVGEEIEAVRSGDVYLLVDHGAAVYNFKQQYE